MKANRTCIVLIMLLCANVLFAQRNGVIGQPKTGLQIGGS